MKRLIANWKQNKTEEDVKVWFDTFYSKPNFHESIEIIIAPSFPYLPICYRYAASAGLKVSAQNVSEYDRGAHTGLVGADQIREFAQFVIIGHSEARAQGETHEIISRKIQNAQNAGLIPIICFSNIPEYLRAVKVADSTKNVFYAYEPIESIGNGNPASLQSIENICREAEIEKLIYGGSVAESNILDYLDSPLIDGFLVGGASLDADTFYNLAKIITTYLKD